MKFDKKVMGSGIVVTFSLALTLSSVCGTKAAFGTQHRSQAIELAAEPIRYFDRTEGAMAAALAAAEEAIAQKEASQQKVAVLENKMAANAKVVSGLDKIEKIEDSKKNQKALSTSEEDQNVRSASEEDQNAQSASEENQEAQSAPEENQEAPGASQQGTEASEEAKTDDVEADETQVASGKKEEAGNEDTQEGAEVQVGLLETKNEEVSPWASKLLPNVDEYLNIRTEASDESEVAGKLYKGALATIEEKGDTWTKIRSGDVEGYVKNEFCVTGLEAEGLANEVGTTYAVASTGGVRVRSDASSSEETGILDVMEEGGKLEVDTEAEQKEGWIAVKTEEGSGYVSADYVNTELELGKAISIEEELAAIAAAEAEEAERARQEQAAQQQESGTSQSGAVSASYDEVTLLGALIQCEAGGEPYEGQLAVGAVVMNRLRAGYAGSISGVIYQGGQFTPASSGALASVLASGSISGSCMQAAQEAINGASNVGGALNFRRAVPGAGGIVIGNHMFF